MEPSSRRVGQVRFGEFEFDEAAHQLRKNGARIRLQDQPWQVLGALLEDPGRLVTRDDLQRRLWPDGTFVDFDQSLNKAITKLREALGDEAERPRYVETVPRHGYRWIAPVSRPAAPDARRAVSWRLPVAAGLLGAVLLSGLWPAKSPRVVNFWRLTTDGSPKSGALVVHSDQVLFTSGVEAGCGTQIRAVSAFGGETRLLVDRFPFVKAGDCLTLAGHSPRTGKMLIQVGPQGTPGREVWMTNLQGGEPAKIRDLPISATVWMSPEGERFCAATSKGLFVMALSDPWPRQPWVDGHVQTCRWHPSGSRIDFQRWEGQPLSPFLFHVLGKGLAPARSVPRMREMQYDPIHSWDGDRLYFKSNNAIWVRLPAGFPGFLLGPRVTQASAGGSTLENPVFPATSSPRQLFTIMNAFRGETLRFDNGSKQWRPLRTGFVGRSIAYSPDAKRIAYTDPTTHGLRVSRADGTLEVHLAPGRLAWAPQWSPDGARLAFCELLLSGDCRLAVIGANGGEVRLIEQAGEFASTPMWSPDGRTIVVSSSWKDGAANVSIRSIQVDSGAMSVLPGSEGKRDPQWSPDGSRMLATDTLHSFPWVLDIQTGKWTRVAEESMDSMVWEPDGTRIRARLNAGAIVKLDWRTGRTEQVATIVGFRPLYDWVSWTPSGEPLVNSDLTTYDIYRIDLSK